MKCRCARTVCATPLKLRPQSSSLVESIRRISLIEKRSIIAFTMSEGTCELPKIVQ